MSETWAQYCEELYSDNYSQDESVIHELANISPHNAMNEPEILPSEVGWAIAKLRNNKGVGIDGIPAELTKNGGEDLTKNIVEISKWIWNNEELPQIWAQSILVTIPKKDILNCSNYRTISLISHSSQILLLILNRLQAQLEMYLSKEQAGFRANRSTVQQILTLRLIAKKARKYNQPVHNCFIDFKKAFDSVWYKGLWAVFSVRITCKPEYAGPPHFS